MTDSKTSPDRAGLVVAGAGARGAYEAGALSVLVPRMAADDAAPTVLVGTSAGALNVVGLSGLAHLGWQAAVDGLVELWASVRLGQVVDVAPSIWLDVVGYSRQVLGGRAHLTSLLDTRRQRATLDGLLPMDTLHENVRSGPIDAVAVATTSASTGGTVVFVEKKPTVELPPYDETRNITYVETTLTIDHVLASAAVPVAFRPVSLTVPSAVAGWHIDGGVRLNVPLKPAIEMGCGRLGVVATHPSSWPKPGPAATNGGPDVFRAASLSLQALLTDRMVEDLLTLSKLNRLVGVAGSERAGYKEIRFMFAGPRPDQVGAIADLAAEALTACCSGVRAFGHREAWLLSRLIGGSAADHGELLSFLLFESEFTKPAADLGAEHARAALGTAPAPAPWRTTLDEPATIDLTEPAPERH